MAVPQKKIGPELGFGWTIGDAFEEPVSPHQNCMGRKEPG